MNHGPLTVADEVERYLFTGSSDPVYAAWPGNIMERATRGHDELRAALISAVRLREVKTPHAMPARLDAVALTRAKVEPMVVGLFPRAERDVVLAMLEKSVVFLTSENVETVLLEEGFNHSAWTLANLYLAGSGAELLSQDAPTLSASAKTLHATSPHSISMRTTGLRASSFMKLRMCFIVASAAGWVFAR